jgi:NADPH-dependent 2,4-dienoyl-CoA reductase/sulfur reductase-like enzyme
MQYTIIGAGPAGVIAAETLRGLDAEAAITLIGDEPEPPYSRMAIPYLLAGAIGEGGTHLRKREGHFEALGIEVLQDSVTRMQPEQKTLSLHSGAEHRYDKLLIATGAHPLTPPIPGEDRPQVLPCWTLAHARGISQRAQQGSKVVLVGAGFIGCIILESLVSRGVELVVVEQAERRVGRMMNARAAGLLQRWCTAKGVRVLTSTGVEAIAAGGDGAALQVVLDNGETVDADLVITATGVQSNIAFLHGSGLKTDAGVLVNEHLQASDPHVHAAGDVAQGRDFSTGAYSVQAIQPTAADHGLIAARNMAGQRSRHRGSLNMNVLDTLGLISSSFGRWDGVDGGETAELYDADRYRYLNLQFEDDHLVGASSIGLTQHVGVLRGLIQSRIALGDWKARLMRDPTRIMEAYLGKVQALGQNAGML